MRVHGSRAATPAVNSAATRRPASGTFSLGEATSARSTAAPASLRTVGGIDALIALQGLQDATERRRQALKRGRLALDVLDELKGGLLGGDLSPGTIGRLRSAAAALRDPSGDAGLDMLLSEIELRLEVEIAKTSRR